MKQWKIRLSVRMLSLTLAALCLLSVMPAMAGEAVSPTPYALSYAESAEYYGRSALSNCANPTALLYAYDRLTEGVENSAVNINVYNGTDRFTKTDLKTVFDAYMRDHPEHFWVGNGYQYNYSPETGIVSSVMPKYILSGSSLRTAKTAFNAAVLDMLRGITGSMSEYEREKLLHDRLAEKVVYDGSALYAHSAYGALVQGRAVCEGYAKAFQVLLRKAGICSFIITGSGINPSTGTPEGHAWNAVRIDGKYYHVDVTWDDQGENLFYAYFNKSTSEFQEDHTIDETDYALPVCDSMDADYFTVYALAAAMGYTGGIRYSYITLGREFIYTLQGTGSAQGAVTGTVKSFDSNTDTVTVQLFKSGSSSAAYSAAVKGNSAGYTVSGVAAGTYTVKVSKKNHVTREYSVTVSNGVKTLNAEIWLSGDVNADGIRDMTDAMQINRKFNGKTSVFDKGDSGTKAYRLKVANVYSDNSLDTTDSGQLQRHYNGKSSVFR